MKNEQDVPNLFFKERKETWTQSKIKQVITFYTIFSRLKTEGSPKKTRDTQCEPQEVPRESKTAPEMSGYVIPKFLFNVF